jgi:ferritin-like metal-binding protein YciE
MHEGQEKARSTFIAGLRNAHAVENQAVTLINRQLERLENYPELTDRLSQHLAETKGQIRRLDEILSSLGEDSSAIKDAGLSFLGNVAALSHAVAEDEILKNSFANFAFENYEIAAYKSLLRMAEITGNQHAVAPLQQNLQEEMNMAKWLDDHIGTITATYMTREHQGVKAGV